MWYIHTAESYSATKVNELLPHTKTWMHLTCNAEQKADTKQHLLYDCIYVKFMNRQTNL